MKAQLPNHERQERTWGGRVFPVLILGPQIERGPGDQLRLLNLCGNIPNMNLQGFVSWKVLLDTWSPQGWEITSLVEKFYFFKAPFVKWTQICLFFFFFFLTNHQPNHWPVPPSPKTRTLFQWFWEKQSSVWEWEWELKMEGWASICCRSTEWCCRNRTGSVCDWKPK